MKQRELKFRLWNPDRKVMTAGNHLETIIATTDMEFSKEFIKNKMIWLQFTGIKDKNGKEIYEGDIVSRKRPKEEGNWASEMIHDKDYFEVVEFKNGAFMTQRGITLYRAIKDIIHHHHFTAFEVIGNIHENAGLLAVAP